jgi:uncharacterized protein YbjT (DUF2867 family)
MRILVTGATGFIGRWLVPALGARGHDVVALVRDAAGYDAPPGVRIVEGDLLEPASLAPALKGVEVAYYLVHSMDAGAGFEERDERAAENFAAAASTAGVERVVYLGGLGADRDDLSAHLRSRRAVERVLVSGDYALTTLRAGIVIGAGSASFEVIRQLAAKLPVMLTPRWVRTRCQPIAVADVIAYLVAVLDVPETAGETYEIGGPDVMTYEEALRQTGRQLGRVPLIVPLPVLSPELSARWIDLITDVPPAVARPLVAGLRNPVVVEDDRIESLVDVDLTSFDVAVTRALTPDLPAGGGNRAGVAS